MTALEQVPLLAWEVEIHSMRCICFAATKAKAQWIATKAYWEAYGRNGWPRAVATRAERHDRNPKRFEKAKAYAEEYL